MAHIDRINYNFKVVLIGDSSVGKTSITSQFIKGSFDSKFQPTMQCDIGKKNMTIDLSTNAELMIWDTCGEEKYRAITKQHYHHSQGIILVYDINDKQTFLNLTQWLHDVRTNTDKYAYIILVGNKLDLERDVTTDEIKVFADEEKISSYEISAKTGMNVHLIFEELLKGMFYQAKRKEKDDMETVKNKSMKLEYTKTVTSPDTGRGKNIGCC